MAAAQPPPELSELIFRTSLYISTAIGVGNLAYILWRSGPPVPASAKTRRRKVEAPAQLTQVFVSPPVQVLPCSDPASLALLLFCEKAKVPHVAVVAADDVASPTRRLPFVQHTSGLYAGAGLGAFVDTVAPIKLTPAQVGHAAAIQSVLSRLLFLQEIELLDPANVAAIAGDLNARYKGFLSVLAPFWNKALAPRPPWSEVQRAYDEAPGAYMCLVSLLGRNKYILGTEAPTHLDAQIAAHVIILLSLAVPRSPLRALLTSADSEHKLTEFAKQFASIDVTTCQPMEPAELRASFTRQRVLSSFFALSIHAYTLAALIGAYIYLSPRQRHCVVSTVLRSGPMLQLAGPLSAGEAKETAQAEDLRNSLKDMWQRHGGETRQ